MLLSLSPFDLGRLGNDTKLPSPCLQLPLDNPPLSKKKKSSYRDTGNCKECLMKQMTTYLPLEWVIWIFFLAYLSSLFAMKTHVHALNPAQRIISGQKGITKVCESSQADPWGMSPCHRKITGFGFKIRYWFPLCDLVSLLSLLVSFTEWQWGWNGIFYVKGICCYFMMIKGPQHRTSVPGCLSNLASTSPPLNMCVALDLENGCSL